ncbi:MAG: TadE family protein [Planctomycetota bacterium]|nr:TadE family protein [Planctomycetota bacterium]
MNRTRQAGKLGISVSATLAGVAVVVLCAEWALVSLDDGWVGRCFRSRISLYAGAVALVCLVGLYILTGAAWRLGRSQRKSRPRTKETGTAAVEFALLFPFALMILLMMIQSMLLMAGNLAVHHAAYAAARSAVVWVPENLSHDEPKNVLASPNSSAKFHRIRSAAVYAVMPVSAGKGDWSGEDPGNAAVIQEGLERFWQLYGSSAPNWVQTMLAGKYRYAWNFTEVSLSDPAGGGAYGDHETINVQVRHRLYLSVPYADLVFSLIDGEELPGASGHYAMIVNAGCSLTNQGVEDEIDVEQFPRYEER